MVWLHGGGLTVGESDDYDPTRLVEQGVIVVTVNYRLGYLGFLAHPALSAESGGASGNYGLMDQQAALRWVQRNIERFGGNEDDVTIFGQSAGGLSVHSHLASPRSAGLFDRAIAQSGAYATSLPSRRGGADERYRRRDRLRLPGSDHRVPAVRRRGNDPGGAAGNPRRNPADRRRQRVYTLDRFGAGDGGPPGGDEMYYLWIVLWSAYYLSRRACAANVAFVLAAYAATLVAIDPGPNGMSRWISLGGLVIGSAVVVRLLTERIEELVGDLRRAASTDPLTGLPNRRGLEAAYARAFASHQRSGRPFALIMADLDRFKQLNDERGHSAGDVALAEVAEVLRREVREVDTAARIGGDDEGLAPRAGRAAGHTTEARPAPLRRRR